MMKDVMTGVYTYNGEDFTFEYKTDLSVEEKDIFVLNVCDIIIDEDYHSLLRNLAFDLQLIDVFSDVDLSEMKKAENNISLIEVFIKETNIPNIIKVNLKEGLLEELNEAIDANVEYRTGIHKNALGEALASFVKTLESNIKGVDAETMMEAANALSGLGGELNMDNLVKSYINLNKDKVGSEEK